MDSGRFDGDLHRAERENVRLTFSYQAVEQVPAITGGD